MSGESSPLVCLFCAQAHAPVELRRGRRASCVRCGGLLARSSIVGSNALRAYIVTGAVLAVPSVILPLVTVANIGGKRSGYILTGAEAYWDENMRVAGVWVAICGTVAPLILLGILAALAWPGVLRDNPAAHRGLRHAAHALQYWAAPEVHVLAVLVALTKLGSLVQVSIGAGLWFYAAMSVATLLAWHQFETEAESPGLATRGGERRVPIDPAQGLRQDTRPTIA